MDEQIQNAQIDDAKIGPYTVGIGKDIEEIICINLKTRPEKRQDMINVMRDYPFRFFTAEPVGNPVQGCFESHVACIQYAKERGYKNVLIIEDDIKLVKSLRQVPPFPEHWSFIYLGGLAMDVYKWGNAENHYIKGRYICCHSYLVNHNVFDAILDGCQSFTGTPIDEYLASKLHINHKVTPAYGLLDSYIIQKEGYSDIERRVKWGGRWQERWPRVGEMFNAP